jgi:hypothetical protein
MKFCSSNEDNVDPKEFKRIRTLLIPLEVSLTPDGRPEISIGDRPCENRRQSYYRQCQLKLLNWNRLRDRAAESITLAHVCVGDCENELALVPCECTSDVLILTNSDASWQN